jgi:hypothetical protein
MTEKIEPAWQKDIPLRCLRCEGCRDISPLAYNAYHLEEKVRKLEERNAFLEAQCRAAMERGSDSFRATMKELLGENEPNRRRCG